MKTKVLIIDDSSYMRGKIRTILKDDTYETDEAENGIKALQKAASKAFDIILLDIIMPEMDGLKVLKALADHDHSPVIVMTADIQESVSKQCIELGARAVLHKPPKEEELLQAIEDILESRKGENP
jgi:CheY-like chemotaxis protein